MAQENPIGRRAAAILGIALTTAAALAVAPVGAQGEDRLSKKERKKVSKLIDKRLGPALASEQDACQNGAVFAYAVIDGEDVSIAPEFSTSGIRSQFNCRGGNIEASWHGSGIYRVRIPGLTTPTITEDHGLALVGTVGSQPASIENGFLSFEATAGNDYVDVETVFPDSGGEADAVFTIAALNDPSP